MANAIIDIEQKSAKKDSNERGEFDVRTRPMAEETFPIDALTTNPAATGAALPLQLVAERS